jgi:hypothetical protein
MTSMQMYWLVMLDNIRNCCTGLVVASIAIMLVIGIIAAVMASNVFCESDRQRVAAARPRLWSAAKKVIPFFVVFLAGTVFVPSTKQAAVIIVVPKVCNAVESSPELMAIPGKLGTLAGEWLEELRPEKQPTTQPAEGNK